MANTVIILPAGVAGNFSGSFTPSGLTIAGLVTEVVVPDNAWVPIPTSPLTDRNAMNIQNITGFEMKINYVNTGGYVGMVIDDGNERYVDIRDTIIVYGRMKSGAGSQTINVEELS